jgi:DNA processing protein
LEWETHTSPDLDARRRALALSLLPRVGAVTVRELTAKFGCAARAFDEAPALEGRPAALAAADEVLARAAACGAALLLPGDESYPAALAELNDPPPRLFAIGRLDLLGAAAGAAALAEETRSGAAPVVAIVGTRKATSYGERVTRELSGALALGGAIIVSGMARGIDAVAHRAALDAGGLTIAVLGTGVDVPYPAAHRALHQEIAERGLLLSEELPGARATSGSFPRRNRIIAALARVTIVTEAPVRSGALITAGQALDLGRTVAAVPGPIDVAQSSGSNELLRDGAVVIAAVADALTLAGVATAGALRPSQSPLSPRSPPAPSFESAAERAVWDALTKESPDIDLLAARCALPARECLAAVAMLEVRGLVECALTGEIRRRGVTSLS